MVLYIMTEIVSNHYYLILLPELGNMLSSYLDPDSNFESGLLCGKNVVEGELNNQSSIANNGDVFSIMHINACSLLKNLD